MEASTGQLDPRDARIAELEARNAALEARIVKLEAIIERLSRGSKRQAAPFSKGLPKPDPKTPGRKPGERYGTPPAFRAMPAPAPADQVYDVPPPEVCPGCGDAAAGVVESVDEQVQRDIEVRTVVRRFRVKACRCAKCGRVRRGRHPLQTSSATGCCASQVGPMARAAMAYMNKSLGLSMGKVAGCLRTLWGLEVTRGGVSQAIASAGDRCAGAYREIVAAVNASGQVTPDETGWRVGGAGAWLHAVATKDAKGGVRAYVVDRARGKDATERLISEGYAGVMVHDGWSPYDRYTRAAHQQCLAHLLRRCGEMAEVAAAGARAFPRTVKGMLLKALDLRDERDRGERSPRSTKIQATKLTNAIRAASKPRKTNPANERLAGFLYRHADDLFTFLRREGVDATNWRGEHAIRGAVVNRKVWGGNRTWRGAETQAVLMSVLNTLDLRGMDTVDWLRRTLLHQNPPLLA